MIICPKIGEYDIDIHSELKPYLNKKFEIQMNTKDLIIGTKGCLNVIDSVRNIRQVSEVIIHMPFQYHTFELFMMFKSKLIQLYKMMDMVMGYSMVSDIKIGILFHSELGFDYIINNEMRDFIINLIKYLGNSNVYFLVENVLPDLTGPFIDKVSSFELLAKVNHPKLLGCFDICHFRASENVIKHSIEIPKAIIPMIHEIHFSATLNGDGYIHKKETHGVCHVDRTDFDRDFNLISVFDIGEPDDLIVVAELSEADYSHRYNMMAEMDMLTARCNWKVRDFDYYTKPHKCDDGTVGCDNGGLSNAG